MRTGAPLRARDVGREMTTSRGFSRRGTAEEQPGGPRSGEQVRERVPSTDHLGGEEGLAVDLAQRHVGDAIAAGVVPISSTEAGMERFEAPRHRAALGAPSAAAYQLKCELRRP
jgi:hypothetical protein